MNVKINTHGTRLPVQNGDWIDLFTAEDVSMEQGDFKVISLGVSMELPAGYEAHILPRSSTCKNWGVMMANSMGIVDNSYCGDGDIWGFPCVAIRQTFIPYGTRICQFRVVKNGEPIEFEKVEFLGNESRGGFGSTGV